ncbi:MAG: hypothetical protein QF805_16570 [Pirellulaceae bacterium]|nr:hypothetical protein [Pirellulaceae bacterium]
MLRFKLSTLMWLTVLIGIGLAWRHDRQQMDKRLARIEKLMFPPEPWAIQRCLGKPDEPTGMGSNAWCPASPDTAPEWLTLKYDKRVRPSSILIYETYATGAVNKVTGFDSRGNEVVLWTGKDPTPTGALGTLRIAVKKTIKTDRIKIYLDCPNASGWNCIDAVALLDRFGRKQWAVDAEASSVYNSGYSGYGGGGGLFIGGMSGNAIGGSGQSIGP